MLAASFPSGPNEWHAAMCAHACTKRLKRRRRGCLRAETRPLLDKQLWEQGTRVDMHNSDSSAALGPRGSWPIILLHVLPPVESRTLEGPLLERMISKEQQEIILKQEEKSQMSLRLFNGVCKLCNSVHVASKAPQKQHVWLHFWGPVAVYGKQIVSRCFDTAESDIQLGHFVSLWEKMCKNTSAKPNNSLLHRIYAVYMMERNSKE